MTAVLQRVSEATIYADDVYRGKIGKGLYILLGVDRGDSEKDADALADKIVKLRIFNDDNGKMNLSLLDIEADAMIVSNFTLSANYKHGNRPDYFSAETPEIANKLYSYFVNKIICKVKKVITGVFGADMVSEIKTDGPVTIVMKSEVLLGDKK